MRRIFLVLAVTAALLTVVATPAMADRGGDDCGWRGCDNDCDWRGCDNDCNWWRCNDNDFIRSSPFFFPHFKDDCEWEFKKGWFWTPWGWQWGTWELDC